MFVHLFVNQLRVASHETEIICALQSERFYFIASVRSQIAFGSSLGNLAAHVQLLVLPLYAFEDFISLLANIYSDTLLS